MCQDLAQGRFSEIRQTALNIGANNQKVIVPYEHHEFEI